MVHVIDVGIRFAPEGRSSCSTVPPTGGEPAPIWAPPGHFDFEPGMIKTMSDRLTACVLLALSLPLAACDDGTAVPGAGEITLLITDDPGPVTQAIVEIERAELIGDGEPFVANQAPFTRDLLELSNDIAELAANVTIPGGTYSQVRFVIPRACIGVMENADGEQEEAHELIYATAGFDACGEPDGPLRLPSFAQSGLKVNLPGGSMQIDGDSKVVLFDFDVSQSFGKAAGASGAWVMRPVIHAEEFSLTGSVRVELTAAEGVAPALLASFQARVGDEPPEAFTDDGDDTYVATLRYLLPDKPYTVMVELQDGIELDLTVEPASSQEVTLENAAQATVAFVVAPAGAP